MSRQGSSRSGSSRDRSYEKQKSKNKIKGDVNIFRRRGVQLGLGAAGLAGAVGAGYGLTNALGNLSVPGMGNTYAPTGGEGGIVLPGATAIMGGVGGNSLSTALLASGPGVVGNMTGTKTQINCLSGVIPLIGIGTGINPEPETAEINLSFVNPQVGKSDGTPNGIIGRNDSRLSRLWGSECIENLWDKFSIEGIRIDYVPLIPFSEQAIACIWFEPNVYDTCKWTLDEAHNSAYRYIFPANVARTMIFPGAVFKRAGAWKRVSQSNRATYATSASDNTDNTVFDMLLYGARDTTSYGKLYMYVPDAPTTGKQYGQMFVTAIIKTTDRNRSTRNDNYPALAVPTRLVPAEGSEPSRMMGVSTGPELNVDGSTAS